MAIKIIIKRRFKPGKSEEALALLNELRAHALSQPGYISGETLVNHYDPRDIVVISSWQTIESWISWQESDARTAIGSQLESLLDDTTKFEIYDLGPK